MRVISGKYRGRKLISPRDDKIRPTTDKIKETIFNILQLDIPGARVLDLFAGSGALGIECISRGASEVVFADKSRDSLDLIRENLKGIDGNYKITAGDFLSVLRSVKGKFDIIFLDPPYGSELGQIALDSICTLDILSESGIIVYEHGSDKRIMLKDGRYKVRTKKMGTVTAEFVTRKKTAMVTGSFDPITKGHEALINEAAKRYDRVIVACLNNESKKYSLTAQQRLALLDAVVSEKENVSALYSDKFAVEAATEAGADVLVRGIRGDGDLAYEEEMAAYNRERGYETEFIELTENKEINSTVVRDQLKRGDYSNLPNAAIEVYKSFGL